MGADLVRAGRQLTRGSVGAMIVKRIILVVIVAAVVLTVLGWALAATGGGHPKPSKTVTTTKH
jgi:predicted membrane chloride channel (bestrophin family)